MLFHAQFTVHPMNCKQTIAAPLLLGNARGSHAARKHLLLATVSTCLCSLLYVSSENSPAAYALQEDNDKLTYITVAPEGGFGTV